jgi:hypothetical protein
MGNNEVSDGSLKVNCIRLIMPGRAFWGIAGVTEGELHSLDHAGTGVLGYFWGY